MATVLYRGEPTRVDPKDPEAVLDYSFDWSRWLDGDTISSSTWDADDGITVDSDAFGENISTVWLSGGEAGQFYKVTNHIVTAAGRESDRTMVLPVQHM